MGFFTWTLANRPLQYKRSGEYKQSCVLQYNTYGAIVCPDNTLIQEPCYEGYGVFDGKDVYELVVDWNKPHLLDIIHNPKFKQSSVLTMQNVEELMAAIIKNDQAALETCINKMTTNAPYLKQEWKRSLGIFIACQNNIILPYPIKIVDVAHPAPYAKLQPSISTQ